MLTGRKPFPDEGCDEDSIRTTRKGEGFQSEAVDEVQERPGL